MAQFDTTGLDKLIADINAAGEGAGEIADTILMAMAEEVKEAWRTAATEAGHKATGDMIESIGYARKPKVIDNVKTIDIYPQGKDRKGVRNAEKAFILHYGTSSIDGSFFVDRADALSGPAVQETAERLWNQYLETKGI
jgi:hypothetical protein